MTNDEARNIWPADASEIAALKETARDIRHRAIRMMADAGSGHQGGSMSIVEMLAALYFRILCVDPKNPGDPHRDRFVLSKGHGSPSLYVALALKGYFPLDLLSTMDSDGGKLPKHCNRHKTPGIEASTGDLAQGFSMAIGMAMAQKLRAKSGGPDYRVYCIVSDGECMEGQLWEGMLSAAKFKLDNLTVLVDNNRMTLDGPQEEVMPVDIPAMWRAAHWDVQEINGHSIPEILESVDRAHGVKEVPQVVVCETIKGKGVSFMEGNHIWHAKPFTPEEAERALQETGEVLAD